MQLCLELCHRMYYNYSDIHVLVHPCIELSDSHGKTILQFSHAYPCCLWLLPTILLQFMHSSLPVVTVVTNPPRHWDQETAILCGLQQVTLTGARYRIKAWETDNLCHYRRFS